MLAVVSSRARSNWLALGSAVPAAGCGESLTIGPFSASGEAWAGLATFCIWSVAIGLALWAAFLAVRFGVVLPREAKRPPAGSRRRVAVILPVKGVEHDTRRNIESLLAQDHPAWRAIFAVDSKADPVVPLIDELARGRANVEVVVSGRATVRGQKVHNQLAALERTNESDDVIAFIDADANPPAHWLRALVAPLDDPRVGATTGYRYYVPATHHPANHVVTVLLAKVAALLGPAARTFAWGGSMAIRRPDFVAFGIEGLWQRALSDDYVLSHAVRSNARKTIRFVPQCVVASDASFDWTSLMEFAVRQYRITRICVPGVWLAGVCGAVVHLVALFVTAVATIRASSLAEGSSTALMFAALYFSSALRGHFLVTAGEELFPARRHALLPARLWATLGMPLCFCINLLALVRAAGGREIVWRGIEYRMLSLTRTVVCGRE